jgi:tetratricopeptide (TPR) repeat protein
MASLVGSAGSGQGPAAGASQSELSYRAGKAAGSDDRARSFYRRGIDSARSVLATSPDEPSALLWLAANLAAEALTHGKVFALGVIPEIETTLLRLERTSPLYDHAAAARSLANLYWKAPALISVGSSRKAAAFFQQALARAPEFPGNQAMAAAFFADRGDCARARALAIAVEGRRDLDRFGPDAFEWRRLARGALQDCR